MSFPNSQSGDKKPAPNKQKAHQISDFSNEDYQRSAGAYSGWNSEQHRPGKQDRVDTLHGSLQAKSQPYAPESSFQHQPYQQFDHYYSSRYYYDYNFNESSYSYQEPERFHQSSNQHSDSQHGQRMPKRNNKTKNSNNYNNHGFEPSVADNGQQFYHLNNETAHNFKQQNPRNKNTYPSQAQSIEQQKPKHSRKKPPAEINLSQTGYSEYQVKDPLKADENLTLTEPSEKRATRRTDRTMPEASYDNSYGRSGAKYQNSQNSNSRLQYTNQTSRKSNTIKPNMHTKPAMIVKTHNHFTEKFVGCGHPGLAD